MLLRWIGLAVALLGSLAGPGLPAHAHGSHDADSGGHAAHGEVAGPSVVESACPGGPCRDPGHHHPSSGPESPSSCGGCRAQSLTASAAAATPTLAAPRTAPAGGPPEWVSPPRLRLPGAAPARAPPRGAVEGRRPLASRS